MKKGGTEKAKRDMIGEKKIKIKGEKNNGKLRKRKSMQRETFTLSKMKQWSKNRSENKGQQERKEH